MKICLIGDFPSAADEAAGGVANVVFYLAEGLAAAGNEVSIINRAAASKTPRSVNAVRVHGLPMGRLPGVLAYFTLQRLRAFRLIADLNPDIAHFHGAAGLAFGCPYPHVVTIHGILHRDALFSAAPFPRLRSHVLRVVESKALRLCPAVIHISEAARTLTRNNTRGLSWIVENPVPDEFFSLPRDPAPTVFFAGKISPLKNILGLLEAFVIVAQMVPGSELRLAGNEVDTDYAAACRRYVKANGLCSKVHFLGPMGRSGILRELSSAGCFALMSYQENAPLSIAEAMAAGVPVIASRVGGVPSMVDEGVTGFVVDPHDANAAAERICSVLDDKMLSQRLSQESRAAAGRRFSLDSVVEKTLCIYEEILRVRYT